LWCPIRWYVRDGPRPLALRTRSTPPAPLR
jgi:hypothetical protein